MHQIVSVLILTLTISEISSECRKTFVIHCDNLKDYLEYETDTWYQLIVGHLDYKPPGKWNMGDLWPFLFQDLYQLESLTINNLLSDGIIKNSFRVDLKHDRLKFLNFYHNNLTTIEVNLFSRLSSLIELNLNNNNIKEILGSAHGSIPTIDLSGNQLSEIKENTFISFKIRLLDLKSNRLSRIESNAFNNSLETLHLDRNQFTYIPDDGLANLDNLKVLTISHNAITLIPNLMFLKNLKKLDLSYNQISHIQTNFGGFQQLQHLDLSHNSLKQIDFISLIPMNDFKKKISIAFNSITQFDLKSEEWDLNFTSPITLIMFGNPWICQCLNEMELFLKNRPFIRTKCDLDLFGDGRFPSCVQQPACVTSSIEARFYNNFQQVLNESNKKFVCNVDRDMLNLERDRRQYFAVGRPLQARRVGNTIVTLD